MHGVAAISKRFKIRISICQSVCYTDFHNKDVHSPITNITNTFIIPEIPVHSNLRSLCLVLRKNPYYSTYRRALSTEVI